MRKHIIEQSLQGEVASEKHWLDLESLAQVELTSEEQDYPIEAALVAGADLGWLAAFPGPQVIRLRFEKPLTISCIRLLFEEKEQARTQEFTLSWLSEEGQAYREIIRQQYTFAPPGTTRELEEYQVTLVGVKELELRIVPDISSGVAHASLLQLRLR